MLQYIKGDLFAAQSSGISILAHACNPFGLWGGGVAAVFRKKYPYANNLYAQHCKTNNNLLGTCLLVPTSPSRETLVACLFTSDFNCTPKEILSYTEQSLNDLSAQLKTVDNLEVSNNLPVVNLPKINSGIFAVPWEDTEAILKKKEDIHFIVYTLD